MKCTILLILSIFVFSYSYAKSSIFENGPLEIKTVVSSGLGKDVPSAAQNAAQNALTNVVGSFMDATKLLEKRVQIEEGVRQQTSRIDTNIKEYSQGSIQSFEILETTQESGLTKVTAKVAIRVEDFKAYVKKLAEGEVNVAGESLFAQSAVVVKQTTNKARLLYDNVLEPIFSGTVLQFDVGSPQLLDGVISSRSNNSESSFRDGEWPSAVGPFQNEQLKDMILKFGKENIFVFNVAVSVNKDFIENMKKTLNSISSKKTLRESGRHYSSLEEMSKTILDPKEVSQNDVIVIVNDGKAKGPIWFGSGESITSELYLVTEAKQKLSEISKLGYLLVNNGRTSSSDRPHHNFQVSLLDGDGEVLQEEIMMYSPYTMRSIGFIDYKDKRILTIPSDYTYRSGHEFRVPWIMLADDDKHAGYRGVPKINITERRTFDVIIAIQPDALAKTKKIHVKLTD